MVHKRALPLPAIVLTVAAVLIGNIVGCGSKTDTSSGDTGGGSGGSATGGTGGSTGGTAGTGGTGGSSQQYKVGGTLSGLDGSIQLANNGGDILTLTASGPFHFATSLNQGAAYQVSIVQPPVGQTCSLANPNGTVGSADVTSVTVTCSESSFTLGGTVSGLSGSLVLANGGATVDVAAGATTFEFSAPIANSSPYQVTVQTQPSGQRCDITGGQGAISGGNVTSVAVSCAEAHPLSAHITGLNGVAMQVANNANDLVTVPYDESNPVSTYDLTFPTNYIVGQDYNVMVATLPQRASDGSQASACTVSGPTGTMAHSAITVNIQCVASYTLFVSVQRNNSTQVDLSDGISPDVIYPANDGPPANPQFSGAYADGTSYHVHLMQGSTCIACPATGQTTSDPGSVGHSTDLTGTFNGGDVTVSYACDGFSCSAVN